ncbi:hypothetical protein EMIT0215P_90149 [Pseudomonas serboccidentalis]
MRHCGSGTRVDSASSVDAARALIYVKSARNAVLWRNAAHGLSFHFAILDQYQQDRAERDYVGKMEQHFHGALGVDICRFHEVFMPLTQRFPTGDGNVHSTCESAVALV